MNSFWQVVALLMLTAGAHGVFHRGGSYSWFKRISNEENSRKISFRNCLSIRGGASESGKDSGSIKGHCIGIDLGTTYSCVAVWKNGRVEICPNEQGNRITPSYVGWTSEDGQRLVGDAAKNQAATNPKNTVFDVKRLIGRKFSDASVQKDAKLLPYTSKFCLYIFPIHHTEFLTLCGL